MTGKDLRSFLAEIATDARPVDLYDRAVRRSREIRRRRHAGTALAAGAAVLVIAGTAWQMLPSPGSAPQPASPSTQPDGTPTATTTPEVTPTLDVTPTLTQTDPGVQFHELSNATLAVQGWPHRERDGELGVCPTGNLAFERNGHRSGDMWVSLHSLVTVQVPGQTHLVVVVECSGPYEGITRGMVLAYREDGDGYALVGKVTDTTLAPGEAEDAYVSRLVAGQASVTAEIRADLIGGSDPPGYGRLVQERTYAWNGSSYAQTAGPTSFRVDDSVDLALTVSDLSFGAADAQGCRTGTVTVTVANDGSTAVADVAVLVKVHGLYAPGEGFVNCPGSSDIQRGDHAVALVGTVQAGQSRSATITVVQDPTYTRPSGSSDTYTATVRVGTQWTSFDAQATVRYQ